MREDFTAPRFGVEEEYMLLDAITGEPKNVSETIIEALPGLRAEHEFLHSQLETATEICEDVDEALEELHTFRTRVSEVATELGVVLAGTGLPPIGGEVPGQVVTKPRYLEIAGSMRGMVTRYYSTGTHVHVEVPSRDLGVEVIGRIAQWSPVLLAMTANSPLWLGEDTGFESWRYLTLQQWPTSGYPPHFEDAAEYSRVVHDLVGTGALVDTALVNWTVRLSERYPTIEIRLADSQLIAEDSVAFALVYRALVAQALEDSADGISWEPVQPDILRGAHWTGARFGIAEHLVSPETGELTPAFDVIDQMLDYAREHLVAAGDWPHVQAWVRRLRAHGGSGAWQRSRWEAEGMEGLLRLYRGDLDTTEAVPIVTSAIPIIDQAGPGPAGVTSPHTAL